ncbi:MAG: glucose-6-phosphate isomerase [Halobacteriaceae archaeon]
MRLDIGNALAAVATPGVPREALARLDERVADCHDRIERERAAGTDGYRALDLPRTTDTDAIRAVVDPFRDAEAVLTVGIGGSALGARTLVTALGTAGAPAYFLDNIDPAYVARVLGELPLSGTAVNVVSRSGTTVETLANLRAVRTALERAGIDWTDRTFVTTGPDGRLRELADRHDLPVLDVPSGVPGRFSALSPVGLASAALLGYDIGAVLAGARDVTLQGSLFECPAYAYGAVAYALARRGASANVVMPYAEALAPFTEWFAQLWAESLGKGGTGQTPVRALGATDQHSQLQLYRGGPRDKLVTLLRPAEWPTAAPDGRRLADRMDAAFRATEASLAAASRPTVRIEVDGLDERSLGRLLYGMEAACVLAAELFGVDAFTQPAVEWGKRAARSLAEGDQLPDSAPDERTLRIE